MSERRQPRGLVGVVETWHFPQGYGLKLFGGGFGEAKVFAVNKKIGLVVHSR
jgi:hypothetical protein